MDNKKIMNDSELAEKILFLNEKAKKFSGFSFWSFVLVFVVGFGTALSVDSIVYNYGEGYVYAFVVVAIFFIGASVVTGNISNKYKKEFGSLISDNLGESILANHFTNLTVNKHGHVDRTIIDETGVLGGYNRVLGSDHIRALRGNTEIEFSNITLQHVSRDMVGETTHERVNTVFKGSWITCYYSTKITAKLLVREDREGKLEHNNYITDYPAFNLRYNMQTNDPSVAVQILVPEYLKTIMMINDKLGARLSMCFERDRVHIVIGNQRTLFDVGNKKPRELKVDDIRKVFGEDAVYLTEIIDTICKHTMLFSEK